MRGIMGDRYINNGNGNGKNETMAELDQSSIWYIEANNLYGYAMMQKLLYMDFENQGTYLVDSVTSLDTILNTADDSDHCYYTGCDFNYTDNCKERTEQFALMPNKRKINDNELDYRERDGGKVRSEK